MRRLLVTLTLLVAPNLHAQASAHPDWTTPLTPFRIADNLYYVGSRDLASYLVTTPQGDILINSNLSSSPPLIRHSIEQLGFHYADVKILLIGHAHSDHAGGSAQILRETHAKYMVMDADVPVVESGGAKDLLYPKDRYPAAHVDRVLHDRDEVRLGNIVLTAHKTPGHTRGCTSWTMTTTQNHQPRNVVIVGGLTTIDYRLASTPGHPATYPGIAQDFQHTFDLLKTLPCDIFLGAHGMYFNMLAKLDRANAGAGETVWVDPEGYKVAITHYGDEFHKVLLKQQETK
jgi:metallo-beta-lactamase class B